MEKKENLTFKEICKEKCLAKEKFIKTLQEATGVNVVTVYRWVNGFTKPSKRDQIAIAKALGSSVETLFEYEIKAEGVKN
jgi:transcriptional regulator with XRE-family HTH domain